ncbi:hypothetical protein CR513_40087, partial [Mucuna pruriens]
MPTPVQPTPIRLNLSWQAKTNSTPTIPAREITTNPFRTINHIEIKHHFIEDYVQKGIFDLKFINLEQQLAYIFTKPFSEDKLIHIRNFLCMKFIKK